jgi:hypothetical protein
MSDEVLQDSQLALKTAKDVMYYWIRDYTDIFMFIFSIL